MRTDNVFCRFHALAARRADGNEPYARKAARRAYGNEPVASATGMHKEKIAPR